MAAIRAGQGLLVGLLRCGHCGRKLHVRYWGARGTYARYLCKGEFDDGGTYCKGFGGASVDRRLSKELLQLMSPLGLDASLRALEELSIGDAAQRAEKPVVMREELRMRASTIIAMQAAAGVFLLAGIVTLPLHAQRVTVPLDGVWSIGESMEPDAVPTTFSHTVPVPGLAHSATPKFPDVDEYHTHEWSYTLAVRDHVVPLSEKVEGLGATVQKRNFFWYERTFRTPAQKQRALLLINKAQFGTAVWLN